MISFVYFDIGGVVMRDFSGTNKWTEMKKDLGVKKEDNEQFDVFFDFYEKKLNQGMDVDSLIPIMAKKFNLVFPRNYSLLSDFVDRFSPNFDIRSIIEEIKKHYSVGLLTNMYPRMLNMLQNRGLMPAITWKVVVDSSVEKVKKPEKEIYEIAEKRCGAKNHEIFFIDNTLANILAAKNFGWQAFHYDSINIEDSNKRLAEIFS